MVATEPTMDMLPVNIGMISSARDKVVVDAMVKSSDTCLATESESE